MASKKPQKSKEYDLLRKYSADIKGAMLHPVEIADKLFSMKIVDEHTRKQVHQSVERDSSKSSAILVEAVQTYVRYYPRGKSMRRKFFKILEVFDEYIPLGSVSHKLKKEYLGKRGNWTILVCVIVTWGNLIIGAN